MITHNINPILLDLPGPLEIRWYGLMYVLGFLAVYYYVKGEIKNKKTDITTQQLDNLLGVLVVSMIIGARLFYAIFYNPSYFIGEPWKLIAIWEGGLSFHGGLTGMVIALIWWVRKNKVKFLRIADTFAIPLALANALGRLGNFINAEIYGKITTMPWGVIFPTAEGARHPTQLYAVAYNLVIFVTLFLTRRKLQNGQTLGLFFVMYSIFRFVNEYFKEMQTYWILTMGQWLTIPLLLVGLWLLFRNKFK